MEHEFTKEQILADLSERDLPRPALLMAWRPRPRPTSANASISSSIAEAATLAGIAAGALALQPDHQPARQHRGAAATCCGRCRSSDDIDAAQAQRAGQEVDGGARSRHPVRRRGALCRGDGARRVRSRYGEDAVNDGYRVYTTIDGRLQTAADRAVRVGLIEYDRRHGYRGPLKHAGPGRSQHRSAVRGCAGRRTRHRRSAGPQWWCRSRRSARASTSERWRLRADRLGWPVLGAPAHLRHAHRPRPQARRRRPAARRCGLRRDEWPAGRRSWRSCPRRRARSWRSIPTTARSPRWSAASTTSTTSSTAPRRRAASRARVSSRSCIQRRSKMASRRRDRHGRADRV